MLNVTLKIIISVTTIPLLLIVNGSQSLASMSDLKIAATNRDGAQDVRQFPSSGTEGGYLTADNIKQKSRLSDDVEMNTANLTEAAVISREQLWQLELLLTAARNEKTRECRVSGLCS